MSNHTVPTTAELSERIESCRTELAELKKLYRLAKSIEQADKERRRRKEARRD